MVVDNAGNGWIGACYIAYIAFFQIHLCMMNGMTIKSSLPRKAGFHLNVATTSPHSNGAESNQMGSWLKMLPHFWILMDSRLKQETFYSESTHDSTPSHAIKIELYRHEGMSFPLKLAYSFQLKTNVCCHSAVWPTLNLVEW